MSELAKAPDFKDLISALAGAEEDNELRLNAYTTMTKDNPNPLLSLITIMHTKLADAETFQLNLPDSDSEDEAAGENRDQNEDNVMNIHNIKRSIKWAEGELKDSYDGALPPRKRDSNEEGPPKKKRKAMSEETKVLAKQKRDLKKAKQAEEQHHIASINSRVGSLEVANQLMALLGELYPNQDPDDMMKIMQRDRLKISTIKHAMRARKCTFQELVK